MSTSQWARVLIEDGLTMEVTEDQARQYIPCKAELTSPQNDWELSWKHCRLTGLHSEQISFNFKLLHGLLPVKDRLHHLTPATSPTCSLCTDAKKEDLEHSLLNCSYNGGVGLALLSTIHRYVVALTPKKILLLQYPDLSESLELPLVFFTSSILFEIWTRRTKKVKITLYDIRATLEARCILLRETRFKNCFEVIQEIINYL